MEREQRVTIDGAALRATREQRGLGLRELSKQLKVSPATLVGMEAGRVKVSSKRLVQLSELLECTVNCLAPRTSGETSRPGEAGPRINWRHYPPLDLGKPLSAALDAFVQLGYHGANTRDIAQRCGLSVPGLYYHYATKQQMLVAILDYLMTDLIARSREAIAEGNSPAERFALLVESQTLFHAARRDLGFIGSSELRSLEGANAEYNRKQRRQSKQFFDDQVAAGIASNEFKCNDPRAASRAVVSLCTALPLWFRLDGQQTPNQVARQYADYALLLVGYVGTTAALLDALNVGQDPSDRV